MKPKTPDESCADLEAAMLADRMANIRRDLLTAQKVYDVAKAAGAWVYDPEGRVWHTPEEFLARYGPYYGDHPLFFRVKIKKPTEGLKAAYKQIEILQLKLEAFTRKVYDYRW